MAKSRSGCLSYLRRTLGVSVLIVTITIQPTRVAADAAGAATMGAALLVSLDKVSELIRQAKAAGNDLLLGTGVEIQNAITSAQIAWASSLEKSIKDLNDQERKVVTDIDNLVQTTLTKGAKEGHELLAQSQIVADIVPFHNKIPLVGGYTPHFIPPGIGGDVVAVDVMGNFPFGFSASDAPTLVLGNTSVKPVAYTTTSIRFRVEKKLLGVVPVNSVSSLSAVLSVPWDDSRWYDWFHTRVSYGMFHLELAELPNTPGQLRIIHTVGGTRHEEADRASDVFTYDSSDNDIEENRSLRLSGGETGDGWRIVPNSARFDLVEHIEGVEGHDWYNMGYQGGSDVEVIWRARTERKHIGSSGKIRWRIACRIARDVPTSADVPEEVPLTWGMSRVFSYPAGKWKATWTRFDGAVQEYQQTDLDSFFFKIEATGDSFRVITYGL